MRITYILILAAAFASCRQKPVATEKAVAYFSLNSYFATELAKLQKQQPLVQKTVFINQQKETKTLKINDWKQELAQFFDADINKKAWRGGFKVQTYGDTTLYVSNNQKIPVKKLRVVGKNQDISEIFIVSEDSNYLYSHRDTLIYSSKTGYRIISVQKVKLNSKKNYSVTGVFKR